MFSYREARVKNIIGEATYNYSPFYKKHIHLIFFFFSLTTTKKHCSLVHREKLNPGKCSLVQSPNFPLHFSFCSWNAGPKKWFYSVNSSVFPSFLVGANDLLLWLIRIICSIFCHITCLIDHTQTKRRC